MAKNMKFGTIEDMVNWTVSNRDSSARWQLSDMSDRKWDDEETGKIWEAESRKIGDAFYDARYHNNDGKYSAEEIAELSEKYDKLQNIRPSMHIETRYWLGKQTSDKWDRSVSIELSAELGKMVAEVWKMVPVYPGSTSTKYSRAGVSMTSILKRLGETSISTKIAKAQSDRKAMDELRMRNYYRLEAQNMAISLIETMKKGLALGVVFPVHISELAEMGKYIEEWKDA